MSNPNYTHTQVKNTTTRDELHDSFREEPTKIPTDLENIIIDLKNRLEDTDQLVYSVGDVFTDTLDTKMQLIKVDSMPCFDAYVEQYPDKYDDHIIEGKHRGNTSALEQELLMLKELTVRIQTKLRILLEYTEHKITNDYKL